MTAPRTDSVSRKKRSQIMSAIRSTGNKATEAVLVSILRKHGINGWRRKVRLRGNPDFVFPKQRTAIFVDGCFWHGCARHCRMPKGNSAYWNPKFFGGKRRDRSGREICVAQVGGCCAYGNMSWRQSTRNAYPGVLNRRCSDQRLAAGLCS